MPKDLSRLAACDAARDGALQALLQLEETAGGASKNGECGRLAPGQLKCQHSFSFNV